MFIDAELLRLREPPAATQWSQMTQTPDDGAYGMADLLYVVPSNPAFPAKVFFLIISDGQSYAIAVTAESVLKGLPMDLTAPVTRLAMVRYTQFVPLNPQTVSPEFMEYVEEIHGSRTVLQVTEVILQGRGPALHRPYYQIRPPPSNTVPDASEEEDLHYQGHDEFNNVEREERKTAAVQVDRAPQFQRIYSDPASPELPQSESQGSSCGVM